MRTMTFGETLSCWFWAGLAFGLLQWWKPEWGGEWLPYVGAGVCFVFVMQVFRWIIEEEVEKAEAKERAREERQAQLEMEKHLATLQYQDREKG